MSGTAGLVVGGDTSPDTATAAQVARNRGSSVRLRVGAALAVIALLQAAAAYVADTGADIATSRSAEILQSARLQHLTSSIACVPLPLGWLRR